MDTITTPAGQYTVPTTSIVHNAQVSLTDRSPASIVHLTQYDTTMPIIAVALTANGQPYIVPSGAAVNVRLAKPDGTFVYNPALGVSEDAQTAYIGTTVQMTTVWGRLNAIVEVVLNGAVAGTGIFILDITANPIPENAIESLSEFLTIQQIAAQVQQAADLLDQQSTNLQNLTDNLEAVQGAASNALAAKNAAEEAKQAAQQALGFRTFFDAISPDENGSLDPSRPMTTAAAQASWTVKSKGDRIQSVQVNGGASGGQSGGIGLIKTVFDESNANSFVAQQINQYGFINFLFKDLSNVAGGESICFGSYLKYTTEGYNTSKYPNIRLAAGILYLRIPGSWLIPYGYTSLSDAVQALSRYLTDNPLQVWYTPADESQATGLYIPVEIQGHEYRCQCLPITEALGVGDSVQSNVPSGCDKSIMIDGSTITVTASGSAYVATAENAAAGGVVYANGLSGLSLLAGQVSIPATSFPSTVTNAETANTWLQSNPQTVYYQSSAYAEQSDNPVELETHASGAVYAHPSVELVAVPYTETDATTAQQLAATPSTLPYIDSADVPTLLDAAEPEASAATLASTLPVAGTYVVSSQDGTTVAVTLKAFQDGGDAATLGGMTAVEAMLNFVYPVGSIYMSANNVSPQTFLGGTWQQIQGQFLLAASGSYPAGSTGGEAQHTLTVDEIPSHQHEIQYMASNEAGSEWSGQAGTCTTKTGTTGFVGGGQAHNNMPPYLAVYMWQRTE